ncbi:MAG: enoyl-CoA hydratase-related protein [Betaproteobacteria bacterium]|nr:enoyl-CoA hydratase-related protein [Betaproteobacteria bacterium]
MHYQTISYDLRPDGAAILRLNRPEAKNAMNGVMYDEARELLARIDQDPAIRVLILTGNGSAFCSGGDFKYQQSQAARPEKERLAEASKLALWLGELDRLAKPVIGRINGAAYGGGVGLASVCDVVIAHAGVKFCLSEASIGLMPSMISPYVVAKIGLSNARSVFLNSRVFDAEEARRFGLVHEVVSEDQLDAAVEKQVQLFLRCAPGAVAATKKLIAHVNAHGEEENFRHTVDLVSRMWASKEAAEGIASFLEKREPSWRVRSPESALPKDSK